ncbi:glycosyltransferase family 2 protein [Furfurilactobacillus milii]|uniref:Glycosyltransferase n=1 Tax=Furfurilactobacillus milii TaxID=2888272 RepID=A0A6N9I0L3_9LACO|nr:glycosyltransferase family 2 protein [Furfurilactobacillus milii]MYV16378.1 glycosyltransferase [Furfurilactobacillus milii]
MKYGSIIVTFNRKKLLLEAINSLLNQTVAPDYIILIDNHSTDGTKAMLDESGILKNSKLIYQFLPENVGGAGGFHEGVKIARNLNIDWVSLSDDDAIFNNNYFENIDNSVIAHPDVKAFSGTVKLEDGRIQNDQRGNVYNPYWLRRRGRSVEDFQNQDELNIDWFTFCGCLINIDLIKKIGLPESKFFIWWDDVEYSMRIREYSKIINVNKAVLIHKTAIPSIDIHTKYVRDWRSFYDVRNTIFLLKKHGKNRVITTLYLIYWFPRLMIKICGNAYSGNRWYLIKAYVRAYIAGLSGKGGLSRHYLPGSSKQKSNGGH